MPRAQREAAEAAEVEALLLKTIDSVISETSLPWTQARLQASGPPAVVR